MLHNAPTQKSLWLSLWHEGEVACLFADTNMGKSIYAIQIADHVSQSRPVLYFDFEMSDKQFQLRYTDANNGSIHSLPTISCEWSSRRSISMSPTFRASYRTYLQ